MLGPPTAVEDSDTGAGWRYRIAGGQVRLEIFPAAGLTWLCSEQVRLHLTGLLTVDRRRGWSWPT